MARTSHINAANAGGAFFMFMGQHQTRTNNRRRNPWGGVVGMAKPAPAVVNQTELSRDHPMPEAARGEQFEEDQFGNPHTLGSLSAREQPRPPSYAKPPSSLSARGPGPAAPSMGAQVAARDFMDELDEQYEQPAALPQPPAAPHYGAGAGGGVAGSDPGDMWVTGTMPGAPPPRADLVLPGIMSHRSPRMVGGRQPAPPKGGGPPGKVRHNDPNAVVNKKVDKAVKLIRSILSSWDSSLRKTFNTIDADRGGTIDLEEFSNFLNRVLHLNFDDETMRGIMAKFGSGNHDISYQRFCELVMGQDRMDNSSLVMASKHSANDIHSNSEMLMRKRIRESGKDLRQVFRDMDRDGSGAVSYDELKQLLGRFNIHMSDAQFNEMILKIDENSDGEITYTELMSYFRKNQVDTAQGMIERVKGMSVEESLLMIRQKIINKCGAQADNMHRAFRVFDKDGSGEIGVEEFQEVMQKEMMLIFDDKLANEIIDTLDTDHSGSIGFKEFCKYIMGCTDKNADEMSLKFGQPDHLAPPSQRQGRTVDALTMMKESPKKVVAVKSGLY